MAKKSSTSFIKKHVFGNIVAKAMALAMALALWLYAYNFSLARNKTYVVPVRVETSVGWNVSSISPQTVKVTLRCPRRFETRVDQVIETSKIRCTVPADMEGLDQQQNPVTLVQSLLGLPTDLGITVDAFDPAHVHVTLVREEERSLNVKLILSDPPAGYEVVQQYPIPSQVRVRGPKDVIRDVEFVETSEVNINFPPLSPFVQEWSPSDLPVELLPYVTLDGVQHPITFIGNTQVRCRVRLAQVTAQKTLPDVPINLNVPPDYPYVVNVEDQDPWTTSVTVTGPERVVSTLTAENIDLYITIDEDLKPDKLTLLRPVYANIVGVQNARELVIAKLGLVSCEVRIMEREE